MGSRIRVRTGFKLKARTSLGQKRVRVSRRRIFLLLGRVLVDSDKIAVFRYAPVFFSLYCYQSVSASLHPPSVPGDVAGSFDLAHTVFFYFM